MKVFLIDGTYELFRQYFGRPSHLTAGLEEVGAVRGVLGSTLQLIETGATHLGVATDHVVESFRNSLWAGYKTGEGIAEELKSQFPILEEALMAMGVATWPMVDLEADDGLASAAAIASRDESVQQVAILTPDKDLAQCVRGSRVVQVDRRNTKVFDQDAVLEKFGVLPASIPDYLALVGDSADGFPGISGFGAKTAAAVLRKFEHIENVPVDPTAWGLPLRGAVNLSATLQTNLELALLFKDLATLRIDETLFDTVEDLRWRGPTPAFAEMCERIDGGPLLERAERLGAALNG